jgi:hypothetical protein
MPCLIRSPSKKLIFSALCIISSSILALPISAQAAHICWVDHVTRHEDSLQVFLMEGYSRAVRSIVGRDGTRANIPMGQSDFFTLRDGDTAYLSTLPEDSCTAKVTSADNVLSLELQANACIGSTGCHQSKEFIKPD